MKQISSQLLVFTIILSVCCTSVITYNGQPGCKTENEILVQKYRNFWDPTKYWLCLLRGSPATTENCEPGFMFKDEVKQCIHYSEWEWTPPVDPPSRP